MFLITAKIKKKKETVCCQDTLKDRTLFWHFGNKIFLGKKNHVLVFFWH